MTEKQCLECDGTLLEEYCPVCDNMIYVCDICGRLYSPEELENE